jgi:nucleotide-binding universal stress UspA family protein
MIAIKNILVATDFGPAADTALTYGRALADSFGATVHLLHVVQSVPFVAPTYDYVGVSPQLQLQIEASARKQTEAALTDDERRTQRGIPVTVTSMSPPAAIVEYAREHEIDLLVLGTHGRGPLSHLLMGSVAERVVRTAPCPVLTVHHPEHEFVLPETLVRVGDTALSQCAR